MAQEQTWLCAVLTVVICCWLKLYVPPLALQGLLTTALDLTQLEKIELGGMRGKALGQQVLQMYEEFQEEFQVFSERTYDCLDLANVVGRSSLWECQQHILLSREQLPLQQSPGSSFPAPSCLGCDLIVTVGNRELLAFSANAWEFLQLHISESQN